MWPVLKALESLGGSSSIRELDERIATDLQLSDNSLEELHGDGPQTEFTYRCGWARTRLKHVGATKNSARGIWEITKTGRTIESESRLHGMEREWRDDRKRSEEVQEQGIDGEEDPQNGEAWKDKVLERLKTLSPDAFERLCQKLLREHGFTRVEVTGRSGDGGIDGVGVLRVNLLSFHVVFQCKRYAGSVGSNSIRDFRGGLTGRADKGLLITTGRFTTSATREATRDGAIAIDLIDGLTLCDLLLEKNMGVTTKTIKKVIPELEFFDSF